MSANQSIFLLPTFPLHLSFIEDAYIALWKVSRYSRIPFSFPAVALINNLCAVCTLMWDFTLPSHHEGNLQNPTTSWYANESGLLPICALFSSLSSFLSSPLQREERSWQLWPLICLIIGAAYMLLNNDARFTSNCNSEWGFAQYFESIMLDN